LPYIDLNKSPDAANTKKFNDFFCALRNRTAQAGTFGQATDINIYSFYHNSIAISIAKFNCEEKFLKNFLKSANFNIFRGNFDYKTYKLQREVGDVLPKRRVGNADRSVHDGRFYF